ncbi:hypothetical protein [Croceibacterium xixiisoli]
MRVRVAFPLLVAVLAGAMWPASSPAADTAPQSGIDAAARDTLSPAARRVADWIAAEGDNGALPYAVIDKHAAQLFIYAADGELLAQAPVLIGVAVGDDATPGVAGKSLSQLGPAEKTTPAGRYLARYGRAVGRQQVLWVDYSTSVALHPVPPANRRERRAQRLQSPDPDDNRITFGCINVTNAFYTRHIRPLFRGKGGIIYILPDTKPLEDVFPRLHLQGLPPPAED